MPKTSLTLEQRFWRKVARGGTDECWPWQAYRDRYGKFLVNGRSTLAHRYSWSVAHGAIPEGMCVCHRCDNPVCVNPTHLFIGAQTDNVRDMDAKGRRVVSRGHAHGFSKLTAEEVSLIRASNLSSAALARLLGVTDVAVGKVRRGQTYRMGPCRR